MNNKSVCVSSLSLNIIDFSGIVQVVLRTSSSIATLFSVRSSRR